MVRAIDILKRSDIRNVLGLLTGGVSDRRFEKMVQRYYTLYCLLLESLLSDDPLEIAVTDYRQERSESAKSDFYFLWEAFRLYLE